MPDKFRLAVSVGHGKKRERGTGRILEDTGARHKGTDLKEFDVCMNYRGALLALLERDRRIEVVAIQPDIPLGDRLDIINGIHRESPLNLAIELHMNAFRTPDPNYCEVYHFARKVDDRTVSSTKGKAFGDAFLEALMFEMELHDGKNDGVSEPFGDEEWERHRWGFVKGCLPPALVIEPAFLSNDAVATAIITGGFTARMAVACYRGVVACLEV